jgi:HEAT repeat protein
LEARSILAFIQRISRIQPGVWDRTLTRIAGLLQIRSGEGRLVALLTSLFLVVNMGGEIASPGIEAMFYARFGVNYLPLMYIYLGSITIITTLLLSLMIGRVSRKQLYLGLPLVLAFTMLAARLLVSMKLTWFYAVLWLWMYLLWTLQALFTWGLAGMVCNARQVKRLFPLLGGGGIFGGALGGLLTRPLVGFLGTENLLLVWAGALLVAFGLVRVLITYSIQPYRRSRWQSSPSLIDEIRDDIHYVSGSSLMRWIAIGTIFFSVLFFSLAFPFSKGVANWFSNENLMAGFLGLFQGLTTGVALIISLFLANRLYTAVGLLTTLLAFALIYLFGFGVLLVSATFYLLVMVRFIQMVWRQGVADTAYQATFNLVPENQRENIRTFINGFPQQIGVILTGLILIVGQEWLQPQHLFLIGMGAALVTTWVIWKGRQAYKNALMEALRAGQPNVFFSEQAPFGGLIRDGVAIETVVAGLSKPDPRIRYVSAEILANMPVPGAAQPLVRALEDPEESVRVAALRALSRANETSALLDISACLDDPEPDVRLQAMQALYQLAKYPRGLRIQLDQRLNDPDPRLRAQAASFLLRLGDHSRARQVLPPMLASADPQVRQAALQAYAAWASPDGFAVAREFLHDPSPIVRHAAANALAKIDSEQARPELLMILSDENRSVREQAAVLLGEMGKPALPAVLQALQQPDLEEGALLALNHLPVAGASDEIRDFARRKVEIALRYGGFWHNILQFSRSSDRLELLAAALLEVARRNAVQAIRAMGVLEEPPLSPSVLDGLESLNPLPRANALEILDNLLGRDLLRPLFFLWESDAFPKGRERVHSTLSAGADTQVHTAPSLADSLLELLQDPDDWLCACAVLAVPDVDDPRLMPALTRLAEKENSPLLSETITIILNGAAMKSLPTIPIMERIIYLRKVPLFAELTPLELKQIATIAGEHLFAPGEVFAHQGELGDEMFIVVSGEVEVRMHRQDGEQVVITRRKPGEFVGEMSIISNQPRMASLAAVGEVRALCVEKPLFESMLHERPEVSLALIRALVDRLRDQNV